MNSVIKVEVDGVILNIVVRNSVKIIVTNPCTDLAADIHVAATYEGLILDVVAGGEVVDSETISFSDMIEDKGEDSGPVMECDECGNDIPTNVSSLVNSHHADSCSLFPHED